MMDRIWGKKIGMTQVFTSGNKIVPVTVVHVGNWIALQRKTTRHDGYEAVQIGCPRQRYQNEQYSETWLASKKKYFLFVREIHCEEGDSFVIGEQLSPDVFLANNTCVNVAGTTIGKGFQGVMKRHGFSGGRGGHGDKLGRRPGSLSGLRKQGIVFKGKKMPGHMGVTVRTISNLSVVSYNQEDKVILIKGSTPGKSGSLLCIKKCE